MATGLGIRNFTKVYRESQYTNQGSLILSGTEHNAYLNRLTVEVTHFDAYRSENFKTLPENTHWGYLTQFKGSSVLSSTPVKFVKQRVFEHINQGIWAYHQTTENVRLLNASTESGVNSLIAGGVLGDATGALIRIFIKAKEGLGDTFDNAAAWLLGYEQAGDGGVGEAGNSYTGFPIASPFPDAFKFKADIPVSFKFRLESWYLVNPIIYITSNPSDASDETNGEDEYPSPEPGNSDGKGQEFPPASAPASGSDPRDYATKPGQPGTGVWTFVVSFSNPGNNAACNNIPAATLALRGFPDEPVKREFTGPPVQAGGRPGRFFTSVASVNHGGDCQVNGPGSAFFTADGPSND
jgi:hypothetical protein